MNRYKMLAAAVFALLLAVGCSSYNSNSNSNPNGSYTISGTVDSVDLNNSSINLMNVTGLNGYSNGLVPYSGNSNNVRVFFTSGTTVGWQGRTYRPQDLERGDQVTVYLNQNGSQLVAQSMTVTYNSRQGMASSSAPYGNYGTNTSAVHGTLRAIDNYARTMSIDPGYGSWVTVSYGSNVPVYMNGRTYTATDLQPGDVVDVRVNDMGGGNLRAQDVTVDSGPLSSGGYDNNSSTNAFSTIRGTVRYVDNNAHIIAIDSPLWLSGPLTNPGTSMLIHYDSNAQVGFQGNFYPVTNLQQGDVIDVQVQDLGGGNLLGQQITVFRDVNSR